MTGRSACAGDPLRIATAKGQLVPSFTSSSSSHSSPPWHRWKWTERKEAALSYSCQFLFVIQPLQHATPSCAEKTSKGPQIPKIGKGTLMIRMPSLGQETGTLWCKGKKVLIPSQINCRFRFSCYKFNLICRKYV
jgi:hypothetical protein